MKDVKQLTPSNNLSVKRWKKTNDWFSFIEMIRRDEKISFISDRFYFPEQNNRFVSKRISEVLRFSVKRKFAWKYRRTCRNFLCSKFLIDFLRRNDFTSERSSSVAVSLTRLWINAVFGVAQSVKAEIETDRQSFAFNLDELYGP